MHCHYTSQEWRLSLWSLQKPPPDYEPIPHEEAWRLWLAADEADIPPNSPTPAPTPAVVNPREVQKRLSNQEKEEISHKLTVSYNGKFKHGIINKLSAEYGVSRFTIMKISKVVLKAIKEGKVPDVRRKYKGTPSCYVTDVIDLDMVKNIPLHCRTNLESLGKALGVSKSTAYNLVKRGKIKSHTNAISPYISDRNKIRRVQWVLSKVKSLHLGNPVYEKNHQVIHIDEKWFYMTRKSQRYYLADGEETPHRTCQSKNYITKVMFLAAVTQPVYDANGDCLWDGKIGIFPFTMMVEAKKSSKHRPAGTLEEKAIESVTREVIRDCMIDKVLPAIKAKWPRWLSKNITIQQDNAKPHILHDDTEFHTAANSDGFKIQMVQQPPQSPDLNVLDLGFFRAIQSLQHQYPSKTVCQLVARVIYAFQHIDSKSLRNVWISLQYCMTEVLKCLGNNNYKMPHIGKDKLERQGLLPKHVKPAQQVIDQAMEHLDTWFRHNRTDAEEAEHANSLKQQARQDKAAAKIVAAADKAREERVARERWRARLHNPNRRNMRSAARKRARARTITIIAARSTTTPQIQWHSESNVFGHALESTPE